MKGNPKVIETLNALLADELTAISQYMVHAEMCDNWGYVKLADKTEKRSIVEMKHAEKHIARILFLEGTPIVTEPILVNIGADIPAMLEKDHAAEEGAVKSYNEAIRLVGELGDYGTQDFLKGIFRDEEEHIDWLEAQMDQVKQLGLPIYLTEQMH